MKDLPDVTVCCIDTVNYSLAFAAIEKTLAQIKPARMIFFTDITWPQSDRLEVVNIKHLFSKEDYSKWIIKELGKQDIQTSHILIIQHDGYVLDGGAWNDKFLEYDLIGAPWLYVDGRNCGNGGFTLRSTRLHKILAEDDHIGGYHPEDDTIARGYRTYLEGKHGIKFCPDELAHTFSYELNEPRDYTFGFHGNFHPPFKETVVIKRTAALGDVVQLEPVLEYFHKAGFRVVLDTLPQFYALFAYHEFKIEDYAKFNKKVRHRIINLDLSYEMMPQKLHLEAYFLAVGISNYKLRNPKLYFNGESKFFECYAVIHIDERNTPERNVVGVDWKQVRNYLESIGLTVIQIGRGNAENAGIRFNTMTEAIMTMLLAKAEIVIACDSGPSNVAVALGRRAVIFFGSVNPKYIYQDFSKIVPIQSDCPIGHQNCWHESPGSVRGTECAVEKAEVPPCCLVSTHKLIEGIKKAMTL